MQRAVAVGDEVMPTSGIFGMVTGVGGRPELLEIADGVTVRGHPRGDRSGHPADAVPGRGSRAHRTDRGRRAGGEVVDGTQERSPGAHRRGVLRGAGRGLRPGGRDRHLEAGPRPRPRGRHPDHADRQGRPEREQGQPQRGRQHHRRRVNGSGVTEATVNTQGNNEIVVQVPGPTKNSLVDTVVRQAQLRLPPRRPGAAEHRHHDAAAALDLARRRRDPAVQPGPHEHQAHGEALREEPATGPARQGPGQPRRPSKKPSKAAPRRRRARRPRRAAATVPTSTSEVHYTPANKAAYQDSLTWMKNPDPQSVAVYNAFTCPPATPVVDDPTHPAGHLRRAEQQVPALTGPDRGHEHRLRLGGHPAEPGAVGGQHPARQQGRRRPAQAVQAMAGDQTKLFAIVLDGTVISTPFFRVGSPTAPRRSPATSPRPRPRAWRPA